MELSTNVCEEHWYHTVYYLYIENLLYVLADIHGMEHFGTTYIIHLDLYNICAYDLSM
jgi:hypothetical protein